MKILVLNCGSSSVKYQLFDMKQKKMIAKGLVENIGKALSIFSYQAGEHKIKEVKGGVDYTQALNHMLERITHKEHGVIGSTSEIKATGHRVVHGAEYFTESTLITDEVVTKIEACINLAPLHNPANLRGIKTIHELLPAVPSVAVFDTAFHQSIPKTAFVYPLPYHFYLDKKIRRYGFHGTSHRYVARKAAQMLDKPQEQCNLITCHIGNGASLAAIRNGKSVDTSMGFTPLEGLMMGTRSGDIDPAIVLYLIENENMTPQLVNTILNKESGLLGVSGQSSDMRTIVTSIIEGNKHSQLAVDMFAYRIRKYIGSYLAVLGKVDAIVFTAGIGENDAFVRKRACEGLENFGIELDVEKNQLIQGDRAEISTPDSRTKIYVIPTDEEYLIAKDTFNIVKELSA